MLKPGVRLNVFSIKRIADEGAVWTKAGSAWINRDGSMNLKLDVLPLHGELHVREQNDLDKKESGSAVTQRVSTENSNSPPLAAADATASMGGH